MASLDGYDIFGRSPIISIRDQARANQENAYAALDGVESLDLGGRGSHAMVKGLLVGVDLPTYVYNEAAFRAFKDGVVHTLVDNYGRVFYRAKLLEFNPEDGPLRFDFKYGYFKTYEATFRIYDLPPYGTI